VPTQVADRLRAVAHFHDRTLSATIRKILTAWWVAEREQAPRGREAR
jgi:hypothetical protein